MCNECLPSYPSKCIEWQGDISLGKDLHSIVLSLIGKTVDTTSPIDLKSLNEESLTPIGAIELLINEIIKLKKQVTTLSTQTPTTPTTPTVNNTNLTEFVQLLADKIELLESDVANLKLTVNV